MSEATLALRIYPSLPGQQHPFLNANNSDWTGDELNENPVKNKNKNKKPQTNKQTNIPRETATVLVPGHVISNRNLKKLHTSYSTVLPLYLAHL